MIQYIYQVWAEKIESNKVQYFLKNKMLEVYSTFMIEPFI